MSEWDWTTKRDCENTRNILLSRCDGVDVPPTLVAEGVSTLNSDTKKKKKQTPGSLGLILVPKI